MNFENRVTQYIFLLGTLALALPLIAVRAKAAEPALSITSGSTSRAYTASELIARSDATALTIPAPSAYREAFTFRAVPLLALLNSLPRGAGEVMQCRSVDGFVAELPLALVLKGAHGGSVPWIAIESPQRPWPALPGTGAHPGPFWLVWQHPERSGVEREQWPYSLISLAILESPQSRWPQLTVDARLPVDAPARRGEQVFITQCLPCHRMNGGGDGTMGPDLGRPMNATAYLKDAGLRALIRDPKSVRTWPSQRMSGFPSQVLSDRDLNDLIAYLHAKSGPPAR